ncbi:BamA/TamA family outer membrane protein [Solimonas marina]|uniref:BamA/TamA family outer membrane protein n=1 Tax=Solimonas marina TaxID=2714601 RepID=A0A970B6D1_9GAMM|nr:BamA/TamA family outer membrane protein [Solimonas marina]NKF22658.1 BamA/TamA family outer membrane protein [Solimonas marina]
MTRRALAHALTLSAALAAPAAHADWLPSRDTVDGWLAKLGGDDQAVDTSNGIDWGLLPGPFYTPETSLGLGVALVGLYRTDGDDATPLSSLTLMGFASVTGTFGAKIDNYAYFNGDTQRLFVHGSVVNQPTKYWGIGYAAGRDDDDQDYTSKSADLWPQLYQRIAPSLWAGVGWRVSQMQATALHDDSNNRIHDTADGPSVFSSGASLHLLHDTRDFVQNPARGHVLSVDAAAYRPGLGSDDHFDTLTARYGQYVSISDKTIIAYELYGDFRSGDVPWNELSSLGSDERMRGYYEGRYRDRDTLSTQIEWRQQLAWRHGMVLWAGAGTLASRPSDLGTHILPTFGAGYRFMFKPRVNVRLDLGVGRDSVGFYFQVGEAY